MKLVELSLQSRRNPGVCVNFCFDKRHASCFDYFFAHMLEDRVKLCQVNDLPFQPIRLHCHSYSSIGTHETRVLINLVQPSFSISSEIWVLTPNQPLHSTDLPEIGGGTRILKQCQQAFRSLNSCNGLIKCVHTVCVTTCCQNDMPCCKVML